MGSTHTTNRYRTTRRWATIAAATAVVGLTACAGDDDDDASATADEASAATEAVMEAPAEAEVADGDAGFGVVSGAPAGGGEAPADERRDVGGAVLQQVGQQLAIEAHAAMQTDDVKVAVDRITTAVATRGGRVASADIDYAQPIDDTDETDDTDEATSRATLVVAIPPGELGAVRGVLEDAGEVLSYDQLAEDVTDQLADLDTRIANQRASVERIRELFSNAVDVDSIVRIEAELTARETMLEQMLATQQQVTDRVAMSTLTIDITTAPDAVEPVADDDPGIGDALAGGWSAFAGGVFAVVLGLAAAMPFVLTALAVTIVVLWVRHLTRRRPMAPRPELTPEREPVSASRPD